MPYLWTVDSKYSENKKNYRVRTYVYVRKEFLKTTVFTVQCPVILIYRHTRKPGDSETLFSCFLFS